MRQLLGGLVSQMTDTTTNNTRQAVSLGQMNSVGISVIICLHSFDTYLAGRQ